MPRQRRSGGVAEFEAGLYADAMVEGFGTAPVGGRRRSRVLRWALAIGLLCVARLLPALGPALAQHADPVVPAPQRDELGGRKGELKSLQDTLSISDEQRRKTQADIEEIRTDRVRLNAALIEATTKIHGAETEVAGVEQRLQTLDGSESAIRHSLEARRGTIAEVLAALQRMGRKPLPAILVRPQDMLQAIRTSMLLGAVVPELRGEVETLASDLEDLTRVRVSIKADRDTLSQELKALSAEQVRLGALIAARQDAEVRAEGALSTEEQHTADLARQATSLKDLIGRMESGVSPSRRAADAARASDDAQRRAAQDDADGVKTRVAAGPFRDPARLAPATAFADAKGQLSFPAAGMIVKAYGSDDGFGSSEHGLSVATRPLAVVSSPADGWVSFAGPYRTYGQLLIINTGGGYYVVLAGLERTNVALGQFVLAGEPVGAMGDGSVKTAAAIALGAAQPILYVEFRKDGAPIDPGPWWVKADLEKVRG